MWFCTKMFIRTKAGRDDFPLICSMQQVENVREKYNYQSIFKAIQMGGERCYAVLLGLMHLCQLRAPHLCRDPAGGSSLLLAESRGGRQRKKIHRLI